MPATNAAMTRIDDSMPVYWVARAKINDPTEYKKYADRVPAILAKYGGRVLARGGRFPRNFSALW
jgi:uncharacterized protein (DUF1330 family)